MKVYLSLNNSSYLVTGGFWSPHIISAEHLDQSISFILADTGPPSKSAKNAILAEEHWLLDSSHLDCSLLLFKKPGPTGFFKLSIIKGQINITDRTYTDLQNTGTLISRKKSRSNQWDVRWWYMARSFNLVGAYCRFSQLMYI